MFASLLDMRRRDRCASDCSKFFALCRLQAKITLFIEYQCILFFSFYIRKKNRLVYYSVKIKTETTNATININSIMG